MFNKINTIFVHCSDSAYGEVVEISRWHKQRGWKSIGYHYVILNGRPFRDVKYIDYLDGQIQPGHHFNDDPIFEDDEVGTHVAGRNSTSLGICLIGTSVFTVGQLISAKRLCLELVNKFSLKIENVKGHYEDPNANKTCPNMPMDHFRDFLNGKIGVEFFLVECQKYTLALGLD